MKILAPLLLSLAFFGHTSATYCICKDGAGDTSLQKALDYACGAGADCTPINQNGACYQPNTVKDHCNWAVNSYFQKKGQTSGSCDFAGTAMPSQTPPSSVPSTCVYPSSASNAGTTPTNSSTTPSTTFPTSPTGTSTPSTSPGVFGISPTGSTGTGITDNTGGGVTLTRRHTHLLFYFLLALCLVFRF